MLTQFKGLEFVFIAFTVRNVPNNSDALKKSQSKLSATFPRLMRRSHITGGRSGGKLRPYDEMRIIKGVVRKFEVTYKERTDELSTYLYVYFVADLKYFNKNKTHYIGHDEWAQLWRESLRVNYDPSVRIQVIRGNAKGDSAIRSSIKELVKYETKPLSILKSLETNPDDKVLMGRAIRVIFSLTEGLRGARSFGLLGIFRQISDELFKRDFSEVNDDEMINANTKEIDLDNVRLFSMCGIQI